MKALFAQASLISWVEAVATLLIMLSIRTLYAKIKGTSSKADLKAVESKMEQRIDEKIKLAFIDTNQTLLLLQQEMKNLTVALKAITKITLKKDSN